MQCVILAGGLGTRMWPEARTVPKTLLPVAGRPFAAWQLEWLSRAGIDSVVYSIGFLAADIRAIAKRASVHIKRPYLDHAEFLYDEHGLPK